VVKELPNVELLSANQKYDDLFLCALGFENRCVGALQRLVQWGYRARNSVVLEYDVHQKDNEINSKEISELLKGITSRQIKQLKYLTSDIPDSFRELRSFFEAIDHDSPVRQVSIDISSFSTSTIIQILDYFLFKSHCEQIRIIYTEAMEYYPKKTLQTSKEEYLSSGVKEVLTLPNFSGIYTPGYSPLLIILLGFEPIRARGILNLFQPSRKIGIIGIPSRKDLDWRRDLAKEMYRNFFGVQDRMIECSEFDYREVYDILEKLYDEFIQTNNITIAPLGSKMQTLAVLLFLEKHPDVQLLISIPIKYDPRRYSEGIGKSYQICFKLGRNLSSFET
jgi:hypothetical protein